MLLTLGPRLPSLRRDICRRCAKLPAVQLPRNRLRWITMKVLEKRRMAEKAWQTKAKLIQEGKQPNIWELFEERGYIKDVAGRPEQIKEILRTKRIGAYVGVDPTAQSLHIGHLLPMMPLFWMFLHGYEAVSLVGGATARIGDPTGRLKAREAMKNSEIQANITKIHYQMKKLWVNVEEIGRRHDVGTDEWAKRHLVNNNMWWQSLSMYEVMKRLGRFIRMGPMLSRDTVKTKLEKGDGLSLAEFIYPLMQGWDFWHLYTKLGVQMQIGGSDQFGNIVTGIESVKTIRESEENPAAKLPSHWTDDPIGFTVPLLTDSSGVKFGKSAGNAVWLDPFATSAFDLYGYFMRRSDDDVGKLLRLFTFLPNGKIEELMREHIKDPPKRVAQRTLAFEVLCLVHGSGVAVRERQQHDFFHSKGASGGTDADAATSSYQVAAGREPTTLNNAPKMDMQLPADLVLNRGIARILHAAGLAASTSEGDRLAKTGGAYVAAAPGKDMRGLVPGNLDWTPVKMWFPQDIPKFLIDNRILILRKGKHNVRIIEVVSDEEWANSGQTYAGEPYKGRTRAMISRLKEMAEEDGRTFSHRQLYKTVKEQLAAEEEAITVANNPDIQFPTKTERHRVRDGAQNRKQRGRVQ